MKNNFKNYFKNFKIYIGNISTKCKAYASKMHTNYKIHMSNVARIYKRDMKNILTSYVTLGIILALTVLPSLYAWFNIEAGWDPYANTKGLLVAVVNVDRGAEFRNVKINAGESVVKKLANNQSIGWKFVTEEEAAKGVKYGKYYASLTIPKEFSQNLLSIVTDPVPKKAELIYTVNEKTNAIAPKITQKGATTLQEEISKAFIETSSDTILSYINQFGVELENIKPQLRNIIDTFVNIDNKLPQIGKDLDNVYAQALVLQKYMQKVQGDIPIISDALNNTVNISKKTNDYIAKTGDSLQAVSPVVKADLAIIKNTTDTAQSLLKGASEFKGTEGTNMREILLTVSDRYGDVVEKNDHVLSLLRSINGFFNNNVIGSFITKLSNLRDDAASQQKFIKTMISNIDQGKQVLAEDMNTAIKQADKISEAMNNIINNFDAETGVAIEAAMKNFLGISSNTVKMLENIQGNIPLLDSLLQGTNTGLDSKIRGLKEVKDKFPEIQKDLHSNSEKLRSLDDEGKFNQVVEFLKRDAKAESEFLANPINLKQNRMFAMPNYGSAMSPFYTTLAIWVGAFILLSVLAVDVKRFEDGIELSPREQFFGRYFTFVTIAIMQALVTTLGNLFLLKTYAVAPMIYVLYGVYVSIVFTMIIYTLVSVLGNIGKAVAMVALVLQVSASGGTFPIELMASFFQRINPMMPFTYAIGAMREAVAGIIPETLIRDTFILSLYFFVFMIFGIFFKEKANKISEKFVKQFKESGLAGE